MQEVDAIYKWGLFIHKDSVSGTLMDKKNLLVIKPMSFFHPPFKPDQSSALIGSRELCLGLEATDAYASKIVK